MRSSITPTFLQQLLDEGRIRLKEGGPFKGKRITYHDSCYLGRANEIYEAPRNVLAALDAELVEMRRCRSKGLCCGAGGAQMFKEEEKGSTRVNFERSEEALSTGAGVIAAACPFCNTMLTDGVKHEEKEDSVKVMDIAELIFDVDGLTLRDEHSYPSHRIAPRLFHGFPRLDLPGHRPFYRQ